MNTRLRVIEADISTLALDAIVNAANAPLMMGGGVDGAIRRKAGREMEDDLRKIGRCPEGTAIVTKGYRLAATFVIHTVAPMWGAGGATEARKKELLAGCYRSALQRADENGIVTIAFPAIGTGIYHWPPEMAAKIALHEVRSHLAQCTVQTEVTFCCFSPPDRTLYEELVAA
ncbi:MAG TPA: macro domain-containing protein [Rhizomicrobium sp.]|nr:macro domain-containing protein [Rhizomicrobium sp.]